VGLCLLSFLRDPFGPAAELLALLFSSSLLRSLNIHAAISDPRGRVC